MTPNLTTTTKTEGNGPVRGRKRAIAVALAVAVLSAGAVFAAALQLGSGTTTRGVHGGPGPNTTHAVKGHAPHLSQQGRALAATGGPLPADCVPNPAGPPGSTYQLGLVGTVTNGSLTAGPTAVMNISAKFCGVVTVVGGTPPCGATGSVVSPADGQVFGTLSAAITLIPGITPSVPFTASPSVITGSFPCTSSQNGLPVNMNALVGGTTGLFGVSCTVGPVVIPLSGMLTGPLTGASVTLTSNSFTVPAVQPSPTCPPPVASSLNTLAGLPIAPGGATITLPATASLYLPG